MPSNNNALSHSPTSPYDYDIPTTITGNSHHQKMNGNISRHSNLSRYANVSPSHQLSFTPLIGPNNNITMSSPGKQPLLDISRPSNGIPVASPFTSFQISNNKTKEMSAEELDQLIDAQGIHEMLASLALMCLLSLLMAFLALFFLQRTGPILALPEDTSLDSNQKVNRNVNALSQIKITANAKEYQRVFQISVSLSTLTISLDLCCLFVCCIQFLSAVKLLKTPVGKKRALEFFKKTSYARIAAIGAFLISIPVFFTGVILFTFVNFDEIPALATSFIIGLAIIFCGVASVQNVYLWQWEKTRANQLLSQTRLSQLHGQTFLVPAELSTLV